MKAVILAAGRGSRMGRLTEDAPKCLVPLAGTPLLDRQMAALTAGGIESIAIVRGYKPETLAGRGLVAFDNPRWAETNMVRSLCAAAAWLRAEPVVVSYSDIFYPAAAITRLMRAEGDIAISYDPDWLALWSQRFADPLADAETFRTDGDRVVDIGRRTRDLGDIRGQYMGLLKFTPAGWDAVERLLAGMEAAAADRLDMTGLLSRLIASGHGVQGVAVEGPWGEVDSADDLALYERLMAEGRLS